MGTPDPAVDAARRLVVERNLVRAAFEHLTTDAFMALPFEALAPTKTALKRFFSAEPWTPDDDEALATAVGPGQGRWRRPLAPDLVLEYGWDGGRFGVRVRPAAEGAAAPDRRTPASAPPGPLGATFDGPVVPQATPNPRTIRFQVGPIHEEASRWYPSAGDAADDPGAARLFAQFPEVANVLVGPDFVAVGLHRTIDWERLLPPVLEVVTEEFASFDQQFEPGAPAKTGGPAAGVAAGTASPANRRVSRLEQAWRDLGALRPSRPADLAEVKAAAAGDDPFRRQVAASLLREAPPEVASEAWDRLLADPVRSVRRATVDAMVDVGREALRPLLERALADRDPWVRWKALRGLVELGPERSRDAIAARAGDPDFRVRLEVAAALRPGDDSG